MSISAAVTIVLAFSAMAKDYSRRPFGLLAIGRCVESDRAGVGSPESRIHGGPDRCQKNILKRINPASPDYRSGALDDLSVPDTCVADTRLVVRATDGNGAFAVDVDGQEQWSSSSIASGVQGCVIRLNQIAVAGCTSLALTSWPPTSVLATALRRRRERP